MKNMKNIFNVFIIGHEKNFIEFSWIFHGSEVHEKPFYRVVPMNRLHFIDLKSNLMGNSYKEDLVVKGDFPENVTVC